MMSANKLAIAACLAAVTLAIGTVEARPPGPPPGGPGFGGPGFGGPRPGPGWGAPPPPPRSSWHNFGRDVLGGTLILGLGLGLANAIDNATTPTYVPPTYVAPTYAVPTYTVPTYTAPVVAAPAVSAPIVAAPVVTAPVTAAPIVPTSPVVASGKTMYWCQSSKNFYPFVTECPSGWEVQTMP